MTDGPNRHDPRAGRARKRAIRAQAAQAQVPYSVAARQLRSHPEGEVLASLGRTVYPSASDDHRRAWVQARSRRSFAECVRDARLAAAIPTGRASHLVARFPATRGLPKTGVGRLYHGERRQDMLAMVYLTVGREAPGLVPSPGELAWIAEMGEETAVDMACADVDRAARRLLAEDHGTVWRRLESALAADPDSVHLRRLFGLMMSSFDGLDDVDGPLLIGVRQILDAVLVVADDGHAPGTRVRLLAQPFAGATATIVGVHWGSAGPPVAYDVHRDGATVAGRADPGTLMVLPHQEALPGAEPHARAAAPATSAG